MSEALRHPAAPMDEEHARRLRAKNIRTGLVLAAIAFGFVLLWALRRL